MNILQANYLYNKIIIKGFEDGTFKVKEVGYRPFVLTLNNPKGLNYKFKDVEEYKFYTLDRSKEVTVYKVYLNDLYEVYIANRLLKPFFITKNVSSIYMIEQGIKPCDESTDFSKLKFLAFDIEVASPKDRFPRAGEYPIRSIAMVSSDGMKKVLYLGNINRQGVESFRSEIDMLNRFTQILSDYQVVVTYNGKKFDIPYLYERSKKLGVKVPFSLHKYTEGIHIDLYSFFSNPIFRQYFDLDSLSLDYVSMKFLGKGKLNMDEDIVSYNLRDAELLIELIKYNDFMFLKMVCFLARLTKLSMLDVIDSSPSVLISNMLLEKHFTKKIVFNRPAQETAAIKGGITLDPKIGVHFNVTQMDFVSFYPTIISKFNISYDTVNVENCQNKEKITDENGQEIGEICNDYIGLLTELERELLSLRRNLKRKKNDIYSKLVKRLANTGFGLLGMQNSQFSNPTAANMVTAIGRKIYMEVFNEINKNVGEVIYGDTDSFFIVNAKEKELERLIRSLKRKYDLDVEVEDYKFVILMRKKNYIVRTSDDKIVVKGSLFKSKNLPAIVKQYIAKVSEALLSLNSDSDKKKVVELIENLRSDIGQSKNIEDYAISEEISFPLDDSNLPHIIAAKKLLSSGYEVRDGDVIQFVYTINGVKPIQLASVNEIDINKYITIFDSVFSPLRHALLNQPEKV